MEVEGGHPPPTKKGGPSPMTMRSNKRSCCICAGVTLAVIILVVVVIAILAATVYKPKHPKITVDRIALQDLHVSFDVARLAVRLNLTLDADVTVDNPNKVGFKYRNGSTELGYRGTAVGEAPIPAGEIGSDGKEAINVSLTIMADRLLSQSQLYSDAIAGALPFSTFTKLSGKVKILGFLKVHVSTATTCDFMVFVSNQTVGGQKCSYKTKL